MRKALLTPVEQYGDIYVKRDDLYCFAGVRGGKVRACLAIASGATIGLVTASSRHSPQQIIVASVAKQLGLLARLHMANGPETDEMVQARALGAELIRHRPGHNSVVCSRARTDAEERGWREIPFGMQSPIAVQTTAEQVKNVPVPTRIVVPVGSGIALSGILSGIEQYRPDLLHVPLLGVQVGSGRSKIINKYAPFGWRSRTQLVYAGMDYSQPVKADFAGIPLDPYYEAKALPFLRPGDLFWIVGVR